MKQKLQNQLFEEFPEIFIQRNLPHSKSLMCYGLEVGDGWYNLIHTLCSLIKQRVEHTKHPYYKGEVLDIQAVQVKEKFGSLRFYVDGADQITMGMIHMAEAMSYHICDICGNPAEKTTNNFYASRCKEHKYI